MSTSSSLWAHCCSWPGARRSLRGRRARRQMTPAPTPASSFGGAILCAPPRLGAPMRAACRGGSSILVGPDRCCAASGVLGGTAAGTCWAAGSSFTSLPCVRVYVRGNASCEPRGTRCFLYLEHLEVILFALSCRLPFDGSPTFRHSSPSEPWCFDRASHSGDGVRCAASFLGTSSRLFSKPRTRLQSCLLSPLRSGYVWSSYGGWKSCVSCKLTRRCRCLLLGEDCCCRSMYLSRQN